MDPLIAPLRTFRRTDTTDWDNAWVGMEPTFSNARAIRLWETVEVEDDYFRDPYMLGVQKSVARDIKKKFEKQAGKPWCFFDDVDRDEDLDPWGMPRQNLKFQWKDRSLPDLEVRFTLDPETWEFSIKPVPLAWFYDERFVRFLQEYVWEVPLKHDLAASTAHGGGQFSLSAKTFLTGSLLADDIAAHLNHPELSTWILDWPNPDDRPFRATRARFAAFRRILDQYWAGAFHPRATGVLTAAHAILDRGFDPAPSPPRGAMKDVSTLDTFRMNFAFGRAVRHRAQNIHPGYWQAAGPKEDGYRPDQIMRYGEGNLNRLQIAGERHVKSGKPLDAERVPEFDAPLDPSMIADEASWEDRGQMGRTSARDFAEALLLHVHHARYLQRRPHPKVRASLLQDQILGGAEETLARRAPAALSKLRREAQKLNLETSGGRIRSEWIEPETLFWAAWRALDGHERGAVALEAVSSFVEYVEEAASADPRGGGDPMEWHRHRVHPVLWETLRHAGLAPHHPLRRELKRWTERRDEYLARRPVFSPAGLRPPWDGA